MILKIIGITVIVLVVTGLVAIGFLYFTVCGHTHGVIC